MPVPEVERCQLCGVDFHTFHTMPASPRSRSLAPKAGPVMECTEEAEQADSVDPEKICRQRPFSFDSTVRKDQRARSLLSDLQCKNLGEPYNIALSIVEGFGLLGCL